MKKRVTNITVQELIDNKDVPLGVRHWLERLAGGDEYAMSRTDTNRDGATMDHARLIYDVLASKGLETGTHKFPEAARDYIEEYIYTLAEVSDIHIWNQAGLAVAALPVLLECAAGDFLIDDAGFAAVGIAIQALTTRRERGYFLRDLEEETDETEGERHYKAAMKAARIMADPRTPPEIKNRLADAILELHMSTQVTLFHPALVERALTLMFEAKRKGHAKEMKRDRENVIELIEELPEPGEKGGRE